MKKVLIASLLLTGSFVTSTASANNYIDPSMQQNLVKVCEALKSNRKLTLQRVIKKSGLGYNHIVEGLVCNGQGPIKFALLNGANKTASLLANKASVDLDSYLTKL